MDTQIAISVTDATPGGALPTVRDVNCHLTCSVCRGYLIDATTITECLHSFCRSCVIPHVNEHHTCPSCSVPLSTTKPFSQLRRDYTLQTIVYKMVPRLARSELERRQTFAAVSSSDDGETTTTRCSVADERYLESFIAPDDPVSLSLEYAEPNCAFGLRHRFGVATPDASSFDVKVENDHQHEQQQPVTVSDECRRRYFRCPANLPIGHLVKFLRCKFNVIDTNKHKLEILYNGHPLAPEYKLADVAYIFSWKEMEPLRLWYRISSITTAESADVQTSVEPAPATPRKRRTTTKTKSATPTPKKRAKKLNIGNVVKKAGPLVDITSKRSWQSDTNQRPAKRRKRVPPPTTPPPADAPAAPKEPPTEQEEEEDDDDVKLSTLLPQTTAADAPQTIATAEQQSLPHRCPEVKADDDDAMDNNNKKTNAIFDDARPAEFSCSTPIPATLGVKALAAPVTEEVPAEQQESEALKIKSTNWLPKAVFDLDDRDLFAKRLQKISTKDEDKVKTPDDVDDVRPKTPLLANVKDEPMELSPSSPLNPLQICVTPEPQPPPPPPPPQQPASAAASVTPTTGEGSNDEVHDSIGALDLSGSSKSDSEVAPSPQPSPGASTSSSGVKSTGPHPFFMTPIFSKSKHSSPTKVQTKRKPSPPSSLLMNAGKTVQSPLINKTPLWDLINHVTPTLKMPDPLKSPPLMPMPPSSSPSSPHVTLFDFFKSNPFLFRPASVAQQQAQKSLGKKNNNKLPSPKSSST